MNNINKPTIRFQGFEDSWEEHKLRELLVQRVEHQTITDDAPLLAFSYEEGVINPEDKKSNKRDFIMTDKFHKIFSRTEVDDIIYNPANVIHGAIHRNKLKAGVVSPIYKIFVCNNVSPHYMGERLHTEKFIQDITKYIEGTVIKLRTLSPEAFLDMHIAIPTSYQEQETIGLLLEKINDLIRLHQCKYDTLQNLKKAYLKKLFPQNGNNVPEIRFNGFEGSWKKCKFSDSFIFLQNNALSRANLACEGKIMNIHYGDILVKYGEVLDIAKTKVTYLMDNSIIKKYQSSTLQNGDIIIADAAEDDAVGKCCEISGLNGEIILSGLHTIPCRPIMKFSKGYLGYYMNSPSYHNQLLSFIQGTKVSSISKSAIQKTEIFFPKSEKEQLQIGLYFSNLDHLITLQQRKLEKLQNIKKSMLEKMFV